jgi:hypothetical protein
MNSFNEETATPDELRARQVEIFSDFPSRDGQFDPSRHYVGMVDTVTDVASARRVLAAAYLGYLCMPKEPEDYAFEYVAYMGALVEIEQGNFMPATVAYAYVSEL